MANEGGGETIKTVLTAENAGFRAAFEEAAGIVKKHQAQLEELKRRSLARAQSENAALRLEAAGLQETAAALREKLKLEDQAAQLARQTGLNQDQALAMLRERSGLEKQLAADRERAAAAAKAQADAERAAGQRRQLSRASQELVAVRAEAAGQKEAAAAIREKLRIEEQALELSKRAGIGEDAALAMVRQRVQAEKQLAAIRARVPAPITLSGLPIANLQQVDLQNRLAERSRRDMESMRRSSHYGAMGLLEVSRAAEDAQYGLRGVLNNIPGIVLSMGGTAGLAGAASLAAVAVYQLGKAYKNFLDSIDDDQAIRAAGAAWAKTFKDRAAALKDLEREEDLKRSIVDLEREHVAAMERNLGMQRGMAEVIAGDMQRRERARRLEDEITSALERQAQVRGIVPTGERARATEGKRLLEDLEAQQKILAALNAEAERQDVSRSNSRAGYEGRLRANQEEIDRLRKDLVSAEANLAAAQAAMEGAKGRGDYRQAAQAAQASKQALNERKQRLAALERESEALAGLAKQAEELGRAGADKINERIAAATKEIAVIQETIEQRKTLNGILGDTEALERAKRNAEAQKKLLEEQKRAEEKRAREQKRIADDQERIAREQQRQRQGRAELSAEIQALKLELRGRKDLADALRKEMDIRGEAAGLAERLGISEEQALKAVRERERLQRKVEEMKRREDSPIRRSARDTGRRIEAGFGRRLNAGGGRVIEAGAWREGSLSRSGLRESALRQRDLERLMKPKSNGQDPAASYWERSIDLQERLLKAFDDVQTV